MKAIILARVSTFEQEEGHSIPAQTARLKEYCERKGLQIIKGFEIIESSTRGDRRLFNQMLEFAKGQKETIAIVADAVDRIQRSFRESVILHELVQSGRIELHFYREGMIINREAGSTEEMRWDMSVIGAKMYVSQIRDNVKRSFQYKIKNREWIAKAPVGYLNQVDPQTGKNTVIVDPMRSHLIQKLFAEYAEGISSIKEMARKLKKWGLTSTGKHRKPFAHSQVHKILQNPFYYGYMEIKGQLYPHKYPPLITKELFDRCQNVRLSWGKSPIQENKEPFIFRGLIKCAHCGCAYSSEKKKEKYVYLRPTRSRGPCKCQNLTEESVLKQIKEAFKKIHIPLEILEQIRLHLQNSFESKKAYHHQAIADLRAHYDDTQKMLDRLLDMRLVGSITQQEYDKKAQELKQIQANLNTQLQDHTKADEEFGITLSTLLSLASRAYELFESSEVEEKRRLINFVFSNLKLDGAKLLYSMRKPFDLFAKEANHPNWLRR